MPVLEQQMAYPWAEMFETRSEGTTPVLLATMTPGMMITGALVRVKTPAVLVAAVTVAIGDTDDADGYVLDADAKAAAGTIYGDAVTERGAYLYDATSKAGHIKFYAANKELRLVLSTAPTTEGVYQVTMWGHKIDVS